MLTLRVTEEELTQLRRIDAAARRFVDAFERRKPERMPQNVKLEYKALLRALYEGSPDNG